MLDELTPDYVRMRVEKLKADAAERYNDPEELHMREDALMHFVLTAIAQGHIAARELATQVIKTEEIVFPRWYA